MAKYLFFVVSLQGQIRGTIFINYLFIKDSIYFLFLLLLFFFFSSFPNL